MLIGDAEIGLGPFGRFDRIVEVCLVLGLLIKERGGADERPLIVRQREAADPSGLPRLIVADTVKDFPVPSVSVFFCHA